MNLSCSHSPLQPYCRECMNGEHVLLFVSWIHSGGESGRGGSLHPTWRAERLSLSHLHKVTKKWTISIRGVRCGFIGSLIGIRISIMQIADCRLQLLYSALSLMSELVCLPDVSIVRVHVTICLHSRKNNSLSSWSCG